MAYPLKQNSWSGGQLGGQLLGATDQAKYASGAAQIRNFQVARYGGLENRAGTLYVTTEKTVANPVQLIPFVFNYANSYLLEVGADYIRITQDGVPISIAGSPTWSSGVYTPAGSVVAYGGNFYYKTDEHLNTTSTTLTISGGPPWSIGSTVTVTASAALFNSGYVGTTMVVFDSVGDSCVVLVGAYSSTTVVTGTLVTACPGSLQGVATVVWASNLVVPGTGAPWYEEPASGVLEIPTAITQAAIGTITFAQVNDVMWMCNQTFSPLTLTRYSSVRWILAVFAQSTGIAAPTDVQVTSANIAGNAPSGVTAVGGDVTVQPPDQYAIGYYTVFGPASVLSAVAIATVGQADSGNPVVLNWTNNAPGLAFGFYVYKLNHTTSEFGLIANVAGGLTTTFTDTGLTPGSGPPFSGNYATYEYIVTAIDAATGAESFASIPGLIISPYPDSSYPNIITWDQVFGTNGKPASRYNVYEIQNGVPGLIGSTAVLTFSDIGYTPNTGVQPPSIVSPTLFSTANDYPAVVSFFQQRILFANTINQPQSGFGSQQGNYTNFTEHTPVLDTDAFEFEVAGDQVQPIQAMVDLGKLIIHTGNGEYVCSGDQSTGALTPTEINPTRQGSCGSAFVKPIVIGNTDIFVQARGQFVRDLKYEIQAFMYVGKDLSIFDPSLFVGRTIVTMCWQQVKNSIIWMVMSDGTLCAITYIRETQEQGIWAWHTHDLSGGFVEWATVVPEGTEDSLYLSVRRTINGSSTRYIERMAQRDFADTQNLTDAVFADCAFQLSGINQTSTTAELQLGSTGGWTEQDQLILRTSTTESLGFQWLGQIFVIQQVAAPGQLNPSTLKPYPPNWVIAFVRVKVISFAGAPPHKTYIVQPTAAVPAWAQNNPLTTWGVAPLQTAGWLNALIGQQVSVLADGWVAANPNRPDLAPITVAGDGTITLPFQAVTILVGLPIVAQLTGLPPENQKGESIIGKKKTIKELVLTAYQTRGIFYGMSTTDPDVQLVKWKQRRDEPWGVPNALFTGSTRLTGVDGVWDYNAALMIQQTDPLPATITALITQTEVGS